MAIVDVMSDAGTEFLMHDYDKRIAQYAIPKALFNVWNVYTCYK